MNHRSVIRRAAVTFGAIALVLGGGIAGASAAGTGNGAAGGPAGAPAAVPPRFIGTNPAVVYTAITPCRIVDTRVAGGPLAAGGTRSFAVYENSYHGQGGSAAGCGIDDMATAVTLSIVAVGPSAGGFLTVWPDGVTKPLASTLNFAKGVTTNTGQTLQLGQGASSPVAVYTSAKTNVVIDVYGYYEPQTHLTVSSAGLKLSGFGTYITQITHPSTGTYVLGLRRSPADCNVLTTNLGNAWIQTSAQFGITSLTVSTYQLGAGGLTQADEAFAVYMVC